MTKVKKFEEFSINEAQVPRKDYRDSVNDMKAFKGSNVNGKKVGENYVVYSYGWYPIVANINGKWYVNTTKYSVTTSAQVSKCKPSGDYKEVTLDEMNKKLGVE